MLLHMEDSLPLQLCWPHAQYDFTTSSLSLEILFFHPPTTTTTTFKRAADSDRAQLSHSTTPQMAQHFTEDSTRRSCRVFLSHSGLTLVMLLGSATASLRVIRQLRAEQTPVRLQNTSDSAFLGISLLLLPHSQFVLILTALHFLFPGAGPLREASVGSHPG